MKEKGKTKNMQKVELWYEPSDILKKKMEFICEMNREDHAFLCGMIKVVRPSKIVEIGVAEGGTTSVIMNCLSMLDMESSVYSVDLNQTFYHDSSLRTGYEYEKLRELIRGKSKHKFLLGKTIAGQIETIGPYVDMVIIDTTHSLPGEILDFLAIFPFLSSNATVLLHDINLNYIRSFDVNKNIVLRAAECVATKILLMTVAADKYINYNEAYIENIGAFRVNPDTNKYICNLFMALTLTWSYRIGTDIEQEYRALYEKYYDKECIEMFDLAVYSNRRMEKCIQSAKTCKDFLSEKIPIGSKILLYGAGNVGRSVYETSKEINRFEIIGWVDRDYIKCMENGLPVETPSKIRNMKFDYILIAVARQELYEEIKKEIEQDIGKCDRKIIGPVAIWK